jgi:hypothetical protein
MEEVECDLCGYCGCEICCSEGFKQHFFADHYDIIKKFAREQGMTPKEWIQTAYEKLGTK